MAPHAESPTRMADVHDNSNGIGHVVPHVNYSKSNSQNGSQLQPASRSEIQDVVCIGFGPASLAVAVALEDALAENDSDLTFSSTDPPKVTFLEKQASFAWHAGMQIPGAKMQITFLKDLATLRNPRSRFTFLNYLFEKDRLVQFTNLGTFLPLRIEYEDYMRWAAGHFDHVTEYSQEVIGVEPQKLNLKSSTVDGFAVNSRNLKTGSVETRLARHVVIAAGGRPSIPKELHVNKGNVIHSSQYMHSIESILSDHERPYKIGVVGSGQSAAEIFNDLQTRYPNSKTRLIIRDTALRPSDDSPFVNEIFDPSRVDQMFSKDESIRSKQLEADRATNYGVVRLELLEHIYSSMYEQRLHYGEEKDWPHQILTDRRVNKAEALADGGVQLTINTYSHATKGEVSETMDVDALVVAVGYERNIHDTLLGKAEALQAQPGRWDVARNYRVKFADGAVSDQAGIWLQGCNERTHGLSDTLLSILATRGGELVDAIFKK